MYLIIFLILFYTYSTREYYKIKRDEAITFKLETKQTDFFAILDYYENYETIDEKDNNKDNDINFLKIDKSLKVNCILLDENSSEPDESILNRTISTEYCQLNININNNKKLIDYPKNISLNQKLYFIFFFDDNSSEIFNEEQIFEIKRLSFPKIVQKQKYEEEIEEKETLVYLLSTRNWYNNIIFSFSKFNIPIFEYNVDDGMLQIGFVGKDSPIFNYDRNVNLKKNLLYMIIDNYKEETIYIDFEYMLQNSWDFKIISSNTTDFNNKQISNLAKLNLLEIINPQEKLLYFKLNNDLQFLEFDNDFDNIDNIESLKNISYYKYISYGYYYPPKKYSFFLIQRGLEEYHPFEILDVKINSGDIEMENFTYFKILENEELTFNIKYPEMKIILKVLSENKGKVIINNKEYNLYEYNQIEEIDLNKNNIFVIKALNNNFILAVKSKISKELINYANVGNDYKVSLNDNKKFLIYSLDYINYDYVHFFINSTKNAYNISSDIGFLSENIIERKLLSNSYKGDYYDFRYYKNKYQFNKTNTSLLMIFYFSDLEQKSNITIQSKYYKQLIYKPNTFIKNAGDNLMNIFYEYTTLIFFFLVQNRTFFIYEYGYSSGGLNTIYSFIYDYYPEYRYLNIFKYTFYGYINYEIYDKNKTYYYYTEDFDITNSTKIDKSNEGISVSFNDQFTDCPNINYLLIISDIKNKNLFDSKLSVFENFYLKKQYDNPEFEFYFYSSNNISHMSHYYANISINNSKKYNFRDKNRELIIDVIAEAEPPKMVYIYMPKSYIYQEGDSQINIRLIILPVLIISIIIIILLIIILIMKRKANKYNNISLNDDLALPMDDK